MDGYTPILLGQHDMRMLMTPLMPPFTGIQARKGMEANGHFEVMPGSKAAAPVYLA